MPSSAHIHRLSAAKPKGLTARLGHGVHPENDDPDQDRPQPVPELGFLLLEVLQDRFDNEIVDGTIVLLAEFHETFDRLLIHLILRDVHSELVHYVLSRHANSPFLLPPEPGSRQRFHDLQQKRNAPREIEAFA